MLVASPLDLQKNELRQPQIHNLASAPASPVKGQMYYDTAVNKLFWWNGTAWIDATGGASATPDATTSVKGIVQLAGDLTGTAASPQIAAGVITDAEVAAANKDGADSTPSMRRLGYSTGQALPWYANLSTLSILNDATGSVSLAGNTLVQVGDPLYALDGANKQYVDNVAQGLDAKLSVKAASTANLALSGAQTVDGIALVAGDRVLVKDQTTQSANGLYVVASGAWSRTADMDTWVEVPGAFVFVERGTQQDTGWVSTADQGGTLGTTAITWTQFSGGGTITDGIGLLKTGNTLDVRLDNNTIEAPSDILQIKDGSIFLTGSKIAGTLAPNRGGTGATTVAQAKSNLNFASMFATGFHSAGTVITITQASHQLTGLSGYQQAIQVQVQDKTTGAVEIVDSSVAANGDVTITYAQSVAANSKLISLVG